MNLKMKLFWVGMILLLGNIHAPLTAQTSSWSIALYESVRNVIYILTPTATLNRLELPNGLPAPSEANLATLGIGQFTAFNQAMRLSDGERMLTTIDLRGWLWIGNIRSGDCCAAVEPPVEGARFRQLGPFSSSGQLLSAVYYQKDELTGAVNSGVAIIDVTTGNIRLVLDRARTAGEYPLILNWQGDVLEVLPSCDGCPLPASNTTILWDISTDTISYNPVPYVIGADRLPNGETLFLADRPDYPRPVTNSEQVTANVVEYHADGISRVVFYNASSLVIRSARWVASGQAALIETTHTAKLLLRDGTIIDLPPSVIENWLGEVPDGWLTGDENGDLRHHTLDNPEGQVIASFDYPFSILQLPARTVDEMASETLFPLIASPIRIHCAGALPSRLSVGIEGHPASGFSNNVRTSASLSGDVLTMIPPDGRFLVIEGPSCDPRGIAWWHVAYQGVRGWLAEGMDSTYYTEPN